MAPKEMIFNEKKILFIKLFIIIKDVGARILSRVLYDLYQEHPFSKNGKLSSKDFCSELQNFNKWSKKNMFGKISGNKIRNLDQNFKFEVSETGPSKLDIASLYLILSEMIIVRTSKNASDDEHKKREEDAAKIREFKSKFEKVLSEAQAIKDIRNDVCHMAGDGDEETIFCLKEKFDKCLPDLCSAMVEVFAKEEYYNRLMQKDQLDAKVIWEANLTCDENKSLFQEMEQDYLKKFIERSKSELFEKYKCFDILIPSFLNQENFSNLYLNDIFTPVELLTKNAKLEYQSILTHNSPKKTTSPPAVVISGNAGFGKTTICRKLTSDWCHNKLNNDACHYDLLFHIEAKKSKQSSLVDYLKNIILPKTLSEIQLPKDEIISYLAQCNILFIIDGYDEKSADASKLLDEIMSYFPNKKFLISTRPHYLGEIFESLRQNNLMYLDVNVLGFEQKNRKIFIDNMWLQLKTSGVECGDAGAFLEYLEDDIGDNLGELISIPLTLLIITYLYISGKNKYRSIRNITFTNLYIDIFTLMKKRIVGSIADQSPETRSSIESNIDKLLVNLASECLRISTSSDGSSVDLPLVKSMRKAIENHFGKSADHLDIIYTSLFLFNRSIHKQNPSKMSDIQLTDHLEFLHKTQIEYLAAYYIFTEMNKPNSECGHQALKTLFKVITENQEQNHESVLGVTTFLIGLMSTRFDLKIKYISPIMIELVQILYNQKKYFVICWKILYETKFFNDHNSDEFGYDKTIANWLSSCLPKSLWELRNNDVVSGLKFLAFTEIRIEKLIVNLSESICTCDISNFIGTISKMKSIMRSRYNKGHPLLVEFYFNGDLQKGTDPNDEILKALGSWGHLENFTGLLGEAAAEPLKYCYKLKKLDVRFKTKKALQHCIASLKDKYGLKRFNLFIHINEEESLDGYVQINVNKQAKVAIHFEGAVKGNLDWVSGILRKLKPKDQLIHTVSLLRTNLNHVDVEVLFPAVRDLVSGKFTVHSTKDIIEGEKLRLRNSLNCDFEWMS